MRSSPTVPGLAVRFGVSAAAFFGGLKSVGGRLYFSPMKGIFTLLVLTLAVVGCSGAGGPMERAGRAVDNAVYDVGTGIKRAGQKIQRAAE
jgi:hypothetical protein